MPAFNYSAFHAMNLERSTNSAGFNHPIDSWSLSDWAVALSGEVGEACNIVKKMKRIESGIANLDGGRTMRDYHSMLAMELADVFIYLDLLAERAGIDLPKVVIDKFNATSIKRNCPKYML